jgi:HEPN domain-containing protein
MRNPPGREARRWFGDTVVTGRSVHQLGKMAARYAPTLDALAEARVLDAYHIPPRYPNGVPYDTVPGEVFGKEQSERAIDVSGRLLDAIEAILPPPEG